MFKPKLFTSLKAFALITVSAFLLSTTFTYHSSEAASIKKSAHKKKAKDEDEEETDVKDNDEKDDEDKTDVKGKSDDDELEQETKAEKKERLKKERAEKKAEEKAEKKKKKKKDEKEEDEDDEDDLDVASKDVFSTPSGKVLEAAGVGQETDGDAVILTGRGPKVCWDRVEATTIDDADSRDITKPEITALADLKKNVDIVPITYQFKGTKGVPTLAACLKKHAGDEKVELSQLPKLRMNGFCDKTGMLITGVKDENGKIAVLKKFAKSDDYIKVEKNFKILLEKPNCIDCMTKAKDEIKSVNDPAGKSVYQSILDALAKEEDKKYDDWKVLVNKHKEAVDKSEDDVALQANLTTFKTDLENLKKLDISDEKKKAGKALLHAYTKEGILAKPEALVKKTGQPARASKYANVYSDGLKFMKDLSASSGTEAETAEHKVDEEMLKNYKEGGRDRLTFIASLDPKNDEIVKAKKDLMEKAATACPTDKNSNPSTECTALRDNQGKALAPIYEREIREAEMDVALNPNDLQARARLNNLLVATGGIYGPNNPLFASQPNFTFANNYALQGYNYGQIGLNNPNQPLTSATLAPIYGSNYVGVPPNNFQQMNYSSGNWGNPTYGAQTNTGWNNPGWYSQVRK